MNGDNTRHGADADDREAEHGARKLRRAAEREANQASPEGNRRQRQKADVEAAEAGQVLTRRRLRKGRPA